MGKSRLLSGLIFLAIWLAGCSGPSKADPARWLDQTTTSIVAESDSDKRRDQVQSVIAILTTFMRMADVPTLASMVPTEGLMVAPYGVEPTSQRGLTGESLDYALDGLLKNSNPEIVAYDLSKPGHIGLVIKGLNRVGVRPPRRATISFTDLTYVSLDQAQTEEWHITLIAPDTSGALSRAIQSSPFERLNEYTQPEILPATPQEVITEVSRLLNRGDATSLAKMVSEYGLVIAPYGLYTRETGLQDEGLQKTLSAMLKGSEPRVIAINLSDEGRIGIAIKGIKRVQVQPAVGDTVTMTSLAYISMKLDVDGIWRIWRISPDSYGLLAAAMNEAPFEPWK